MKKIDLDKIRRDWQNRGFSFGIWTDPPGQVWENYAHGTDEVFMVAEGAVELEMKGGKFRPEAGKEILIPAKVVHSVRNRGTSTACWFYGYRK